MLPAAQRRQAFRRRGQFIAALALLLVLLFGGIFFVGARTWYAYNNNFGARSAANDWLHRKLSSYSIDSYDALLALRRLEIHCLRFASGAMTRDEFSAQRRQVASNLAHFAPGSFLAKELSVHETFAPAYQEAERLLAAAAALEKGEVRVDVVHARADEAAQAWMQLTQDAIAQEYVLRDSMEKAIVDFRPLAVRASNIAALLFALCAIAIAAAAYTGWRMVQAERRRFDRFELLLATVGHDLRSPLQALVGAAKLAATDASSEDRLKFVRIVNERSGFFTRLLDDLISLARSESLSFVPAPVDLACWFELAASRYRQSVEAKQLIFSASLVTSTGQILFDAHRLTQCADNLISNAIRYTAKGSVGFDVRCEAALPGHEYTLTVEVTDTGRGIAEPDQARIFEPFTRVDDSIKGMGVGLTMVAGIAHRAGGTVSVRSELGAGSTFTFLAPVSGIPETTLAEACASEPGEVSASPASVSSVEVPRVLVVDDDPVIAEVLGELLPHMGFAADVALGGRAALDMVRQRSYSAVLTDIQMPDLDGFALAAALRESLQPCPTLIAMTAYTSTLSADERSVVFDATLTKPVDEGVLLDLLDGAARRWSELTP